MAMSATEGVELVKPNSPKDVEGKQAVEDHHSDSPALSNLQLALILVVEMTSIILYATCTEYGPAPRGEAPTASNAYSPLPRYYPMFQDVHTMIFIGFGFLMTFMKRYSFSAVGFNFLLAVITIQYAILVNGFFHTVFAGKELEKIKLDIISLITGDFAAGAVLISFGAVLGKASLTQLLVMVVMEILVYSVNESLGVLKWEAVDMGGSMYVHTFGAYFGLAVSKMITKLDKVEAESARFGSKYVTDLTAMIGTLFLWMFWPSFNGALAPTESQQHRVVLNTVFSLTNSCIAAFVCSKIFRGSHKFDMVDIQNATLAGGVAVGSSADLVIEPFGALIIGFLAGCLSVAGYVWISPFLEKKFGLHDTCGVHNLHGMPGVMGGLGGAITAWVASTSKYNDDLPSIFSAMADGRTQSEQAGCQFGALATTLAMAIIGGTITGWVMNKFAANSTYGEDAESWHIEDDEHNNEV